MTSISKKDDATSVPNCRPISVLSIIPKILEILKSCSTIFDVFQPLFSSNVWISSWTFVLHCTGQNDCELASAYRFQKGYWLRSIAIDFNPKLLIKYVIIFFLQSYVLVALVRRQLTSCIPTCLIESKG